MAYFKRGALVERLTATTTSASTVILTSSSTKYQIFTGSVAQTVRLPNATTLDAGQSFVIHNASSATITVQLNDATTTIATIIAGTTKSIFLQSKATSNGTWYVFRAEVALTSDVTGILPITNGGTGSSTGSITGSGSLTFTAGGTNQNVTLTPSGSGYTLLNGNVGVGTAAPATKMEVAGSSGVATGGSTPVALRISATDQDAGAGTWNTSAEFAALQFYSSDASSPGGSNIRYSIGAKMENTAGGSTALAFSTYSGGTAAEKVRIDSSGSVLIGATTARSRQLTIEGTSTTGQNIIRNSADTSAAALVLAKSRSATVGGVTTVTSGDALGTVRFSGADGTNFDNPAAEILSSVDSTVSTGIVPGRLAFRTASSAGAITERMRIDSSGNVGINTTSPAYPLHAETSGTGTAVNTNRVAQLLAKASGRDAHLAFGDGVNTSAQVGYVNSGDLYLATNATERFRVKIGGNVGIGTASPQAALDVAVTGTAASAILVPRDTTANRPSTPVNGMIRYATDTQAFEGYQNGFWTQIITKDQEYTYVVGTSAQVTAGLAQYSSLQSAITAASAGDRILVLPNTYAEPVTVNKNLKIHGTGSTAIISGNLTISADRCQVDCVRIDGNVSLTGNYSYLKDCWLANSSTNSVTDTGISNYVLMIQE